MAEKNTTTAPKVETATSALNTSTPNVPLFGQPVFSRPDRAIKTKDGKSQMVAQVEFIMGGTLAVETGIWCRETVDKDKGHVALEYSVSLPRGIRPIKGDAVSTETVNGWKQATLDAFGSWEDAQTERQQKAATNMPRLVRVKPLDAPAAVAPNVIPPK